MSRWTRTASCLLTCWLLLTVAGCATLNLSKIDFRSRKATANNPAVKVVCLWEPAEGRDPKGLPCQGFAGQIFFLNADSLSVSVDGDVRVYLFDDLGTPEEQVEPLHKFDFDSTAWNRHFAYGSVGPAYNVFVPYMRHGVEKANCALRLRLTPKHGPPLFSDMTSIEMLAFGGQGRKAFSKASPSQGDRRVEETTPEDFTANDARRRTTTIVLNSKEGIYDDTGKSILDDKVQQAGYEDTPKPLSAADVRIAELEKMVLELKSMSKSQLAPSGEAPPPRRLSEEDLSRIKVRAAKSTSPDQKPAAAKQKAPIEGNSASVRSTHPLATVAGVEHRHPLEDDGDAPARRIVRPKRHPLSDGDDLPIEVTPVSGRQSGMRHPLANLDDETPAERAPRKKPVASQSPARSERGRGDSFDPFEPIDTEAVETTAVEETTTIRQKMRSAKY